MKILFVCSRNKWRSPTAEAIYKNRQGCHVRSAGTEPSARVRVSSGLLKWAEIVFVMERRHRDRLMEMFPDEMEGKEIVVLDIEDEYQFMDEDLVQAIRIAVDPFLGFA
jgi:predicted protein tyrosine phosphatase